MTKHYLCTTKRKKKAIRKKYGVAGTINYMQSRWETRKLKMGRGNYKEQMAKTIGSQFRGTEANKNTQCINEEKDGKERQGMGESMRR